MRDILAAVRRAGIQIADLTTHESDLEDLFLELTREPDTQEPSKSTSAETPE